jgi:hypothetical protein
LAPHFLGALLASTVSATTGCCYCRCLLRIVLWGGVAICLLLLLLLLLVHLLPVGRQLCQQVGTNPVITQPGTHFLQFAAAAAALTPSPWRW